MLVKSTLLSKVGSLTKSLWGIDAKFLVRLTWISENGSERWPSSLQSPSTQCTKVTYACNNFCYSCVKAFETDFSRTEHIGAARPLTSYLYMNHASYTALLIRQRRNTQYSETIKATFLAWQYLYLQLRCATTIFSVAIKTQQKFFHFRTGVTMHIEILQNVNSPWEFWNS